MITLQHIDQGDGNHLKAFVLFTMPYSPPPINWKCICWTLDAKGIMRIQLEFFFADEVCIKPYMILPDEVCVEPRMILPDQIEHRKRFSQKLWFYEDQVHFNAYFRRDYED